MTGGEDSRISVWPIASTISNDSGGMGTGIEDGMDIDDVVPSASERPRGSKRERDGEIDADPVERPQMTKRAKSASNSSA